MNYYNDNDPKCCAWIAELISAKLIPEGKIDDRSIADISPADLRGFHQCHFFCGIAGWPYALSLAGWPADREVWTGSCPCQPFSCAGKGLGEDDPRHLWPYFRNLIGVCRPPIVFGEQVARKDGREWLARVRADLERAGYAFGAADLPAASVSAPHRRERHFFVAQSRLQQEGWCLSRSKENACQNCEGPSGEFGRSSNTGGLGDTDQPRSQGLIERRDSRSERTIGTASVGNWSNCDIIPCADGKSRRVESGVPVLVARLSPYVVPIGDPSIQEVLASAEARVMRLRGYGNAIVAPLAAEFIKAFLA